MALGALFGAGQGLAGRLSKTAPAMPDWPNFNEIRTSYGETEHRTESQALTFVGYVT
jgi:hypothetical protein